MRHVFPLLIVLLLLPSAASAGGFAVGLMGGFGGATDGEPDVGFGNIGFQGYFSAEIGRRTFFDVRAGQMELDAAGSVFDRDLSYLTLAGDYRLTEGWYESALFLGVGLYDVEDAPALPGDSGLGLSVGSMGHFEINPRFSVIVEVSVHLADLDNTQLFVMAHGGLAYHF